MKLRILTALFALLLLSSCALLPEQELYTTYHGLPVPVQRGVEKSCFSEADFVSADDGSVTYVGTAERTMAVIDVSTHQGKVDWNRVAGAGIGGVMIRVGFRGYKSGEIEEDRRFARNIEDALGAGLKVGVYFYSQAVNEEEAREEAAFVLERVKKYELSMPVAFDWENGSFEDARTDVVSNEELTALTLAFCREIENAGYRPIVYFNQELAYMRYDLRAISNYGFWIAQYSEWPSFYYRSELWQYTNKGRVDGIKGKVDLDIWFVAP